MALDGIGIDDEIARKATEHFETGALEQAAARRLIAPCMFTYKLPGEDGVVVDLEPMGFSDLMAEIEGRLKDALARYDCEMDDLFEPCIILFAMARELPTGFVVQGNWAGGKEALTDRHALRMAKAATQGEAPNLAKIVPIQL